MDFDPCAFFIALYVAQCIRCDNLVRRGYIRKNLASNETRIEHAISADDEVLRSQKKEVFATGICEMN